MEEPEQEQHLVPVKSLSPGTIIYKPKGHTPYMLVKNQDCEGLQRPGRSLYLQEDGSLAESRSTLPVQVKAIRRAGTRFQYSPALIYGTTPSGNLYHFRRTTLVEVARPTPLSAFTKEEDPVSGDRIVKVSDDYLVVKYPTENWSKGVAWEHLVNNPPPELRRAPGTSKDDNPYRKCHGPEEWAWLAPLPGPTLYDWLVLDD